MLRINDILDKAQSYLPASDLEMIEKAYIFSASVHQGQVRLSGEPYLTHPMEVCGILADMKLDAATLVTGLLHDTVEDTLATQEQIEEAFGKEVAFLVDGLTKISKITLGNQEERQAENFRKMILAMSSDIRILLVRLADRVHNMRTLEFQAPERQLYISKETLELYAPLANRLGINWMKTELEDLAFRYLDFEAYNELARRVVKKKAKREEYAEEVRGIIRREMDRLGIPVEVEGRAKHFYSIYKKMKEQHINFDEVYDLTAFRVILVSDKEKDCYEALSVVHALWKPVPGRFKDYIAMPKANHYQSLHTTVIGPYGERVEIQIRTHLMHDWAESGIASHWRYKEGRAFSSTDDDQIKKLRDLLDAQQEIENPREFMSNLKVALFPEEVYVFTPNGDVRSFPKGATPIDFAYSIHTDIGNKCIGAKVNRNIVPLKYQLKNGDTVEIITQAGHHPSKDWLKYVVTSRAMAKIRNWVKTEERKKSVALGKDLLEKEFRKNHLNFGRFSKTKEMDEILAECHCESLEDLMAVVGYGKVSPKHVVHHFLPEEEIKKEEISDKARKKDAAAPVGVSLTGIDDILVRYAKCCDPIPGDEIVGYISRGRGVIVHTADCKHVRDMDPERLVDVQWDVREKRDYPVQMRIICNDKKGILADISAAISMMDVNITHAETNTSPDGKATCDFTVNVNDLDQFNRIVAAVKKVRGVVSVQRLWRT
jgi:GTP diphosphokinase / guanosine-3',5'-bis(diphosphate) 3'-diphosphatase